MLNLLWALVFLTAGAFGAYAHKALIRSSPKAFWFLLLSSGGLTAAVALFPVGLISLGANLLRGLLMMVAGAGVGYLIRYLVLDGAEVPQLSQKVVELTAANEKLSQAAAGAKAEILLLDTSALYSVDLVGFLNNTFAHVRVQVPHLIVEQAQQMAASADELSLARGRKALETVERLQHEIIHPLEMTMNAPVATGVVDALVELAKAASARVVTADAAVARNLKAQTVPVLLLDEVGSTLRANRFAGEQFLIHITGASEETGQGVGYLNDGTKVLIEDGAAKLGAEVEVRIQQVYDTVAGRMLFTTLV